MDNADRKLIKAFISDLPMEDVKEMWSMLRARARDIHSANTNKFRVGQKVTFVGKHHMVHEGKITKINSRTVSVKVGNVNWRVSPSFLKAV